jgi:hypothetical protein
MGTLFHVITIFFAALQRQLLQNLIKFFIPVFDRIGSQLILIRALISKRFNKRKDVLVLFL